MNKEKIYNNLNSDDPEEAYTFLFNKIILMLSLEYGVRISKIRPVLEYCLEQDNEEIGTIVKKTFRKKVYKKHKKMNKCKCAICGCTDKKRLTMHHVKPISLYPEEKYNVNNIILLCDTCHAREHGILSETVKEEGVCCANES
jgi:hypothetical protein